MTTLSIIRDRPLPSMSAWDRVMKCGAEQQLMHIQRSSEAAEQGTAIHRLLEIAYSTKNWDHAYAQAVAEWPEYADEFSEICSHADKHDIGDQRTEMPLILDAEAMTVRRPNSNAHRDYGRLGPYEIAGTLDMVGSGRAVLRDWKTGRNPPRAAASWQLRLGALALAIHNEADSVRVEIGSFNDSWEPRIDAHTYTRSQLFEHGARVLAKARELRSAEGVADVRAGDWCAFCPAYAACPATGALMRRAADPDGVMDMFRVLLQQDRRSGYDLWRAVAMLAGRMEDDVKASATLEDIPLDEGKVYGRRERTTRDIDGATAYRVLLDAFGRDVAQAAVSFDASQASITRAIKDADRQGRSIKATVKEIMNAIDLAGGIVKKKHGRVDTYNVSTGSGDDE